MHGPSFLSFALERLKVIQATLASDLALELLEPVEGHSCGVCSGKDAVRERIEEWGS